MHQAAIIAERPHAISVTGYATAHFGKSLWWNGSELLLAFYLTEYLELQGLVAGCVIASGLAVGAMMDIVVANRRHWFASVPRAGRMQVIGAFGSLIALIVLFAAAGTTGSPRLATVIAANILYRLAYVFYDLPQNCMLGLIDWSHDQQRKAASARTAAGAGALVTVSLAASLPTYNGMWAVALVVTGTSVALASAGWLWRATRVLPDRRYDVAPAVPASIRRPLAIMAIVCLTVPAFSKLAPYMAAYAQSAAPTPLLLILGIATAITQPLWLAMIRRSGEAAAMGVAGGLLIIGALAATGGAIGSAAALVGVASGGLGTAIWAMFAAAVANGNPLNAAPAFARLTATAKVALAIAAIGIGGLLSVTDYHGDGARLLPAMTMLTLVGGVAIITLSCGGRLVRRGRRAGSA
ncbi:UNVERIFIED_ORG: Na+/melibiose symporter-like transporter [Sphingomonas sp. R1F5B]